MSMATSMSRSMSELVVVLIMFTNVPCPMLVSMPLITLMRMQMYVSYA